MPFRVYALYDIRCPEEILYIGKTSSGLGQRLCGHRASPNSFIGMWIQECGAENIDIRVIDTAENSTHLLALEKYYIRKYRPNFNVASNKD